MTPKCSPNDSKIEPMAFKGPYKTLQKRSRACPKKEHLKRHKNEPVLASEREARSRLEHCRNKCFTTVGLTRRADTDATEMMILCLHVRATPVVFGRAWRRDLHHVYRASIKTIKHDKKNVVR